MKRLFLIYLITLLVPITNQAQNFELDLLGTNDKETAILDSILTENKFSDIKSAKSSIDNILLSAQKMGFVESELNSFEKTNDSVLRAVISLKKRYQNIYVHFSKKFIDEELLKSLSISVLDSYFVVPINQVENTIGLINSNASKKGYPFSSFQIINITKKNNSDLQGELFSDGNSLRKIDRITIKGYEKFPKSFLRRFLNLRKNQVLNLKEVNSKINNLNSLTFAKKIRDPEILFKEDSTEVFIYLEKTKSNTFDGFLGFGNNEVTNKIEFDGYLNLNLNNNLNFGESFGLLYKSDENDQRTFDIRAELPYLLKTPVGLRVNLNIFKKDSTFSNVNQNAKLFLQLNRNNKIFAGIQHIESSNLLNNVNNPQINDYNSTYLTTSYEFTYRSSYILFPIQTYFFVEFGLGSRVVESQDVNQNSLNFSASKIINLNNKNSIYLNVDGDMLFSDNYFFNELTWFGGINSIRGFEENSIFANLYSVLNTEYRYTLSPSIYIHSIADAAYYENDLDDLKEKLFGFGFGFGIVTKAGLLKFNYANGLSENQPFKLNNSKIHISLNAFF